MNIKALGISIGQQQQRIGVLFQYREPGRDDAQVVTRFVADDAFVRRVDPPVVSAAYLSENPAQQAAFWRDITATPFNGRYSNRNGWLLPAFFQNLLPEGVFRDHVAALRACAPTDNFEMLAACGKDLPGNVHAFPVVLSQEEISRYITQDQDALEMSVTEAPMEDGVSLSGVQPKVAVIQDGDRYVGRTKDADTHIIAKLPVVGQPRMPELEYLSLQLAAAAGVNACEAYLEPLEKLAVQHGYDLGDADGRTKFLAVVRYDRKPEGGRIHCEDFAQVLGQMPEDKYGGGRRGGSPLTYLDVAAVLYAFESLGEAAVHELLRRLVVNEMLGNPDMHLKNIGLRYPDGRTPEFPPAYDIVAYAAFNRNVGHGLLIVPPDILPRRRDTRDAPKTRQQLSPLLLRAFCGALGIPEKPAAKIITDCVRKASRTWPALIAAASITGQQKKKLLAHFEAHPFVESLARRQRFKP
ncbi:type II toxin-antitoxin system HipA family toxin [Achromobacter aloeverae]|uniref:Type II toxin-antitoxin system HipA family toxin n=1 Tax=Achromobacter aloeverae TaxID=1750518 RepID=A0A4V1MRJ2_9BURK|nr:type II toxin-antitoxin system HipA family toxin [Achromobacter aloeverae]RXN84504.1 type II toxin-antitoxin system HipA family toxin [Achromobacter aloeverae]